MESGCLKHREKGSPKFRSPKASAPPCMIYEYFRVTGAHQALLDFSDLFSNPLHGDDMQDFDTRWDQALLSTSELPKDSILESLYKMRIPESDQLRTVWYEQEINQDRSKPNYQKLKTMVRRHTDQMIRTRTFKVRNERIETGVLVKTQKGKNVNVERKTGACYQWKAKG